MTPVCSTIAAQVFPVPFLPHIRMGATGFISYPAGNYRLNSIIRQNYNFPTGTRQTIPGISNTPAGLKLLKDDVH
jgi:hypothetical protein